MFAAQTDTAREESDCVPTNSVAVDENSHNPE